MDGDKVSPLALLIPSFIVILHLYHLSRYFLHQLLIAKKICSSLFLYTETTPRPPIPHPHFSLPSLPAISGWKTMVQLQLFLASVLL